jgi:hypothetical protein
LGADISSSSERRLLSAGCEHRFVPKRRSRTMAAATAAPPAMMPARFSVSFFIFIFFIRSVYSIAR